MQVSQVFPSFSFFQGNRWRETLLTWSFKANKYVKHIPDEKTNTGGLSKYFKITEPINNDSRSSPILLKQCFIKTMAFTNNPENKNDFAGTLEDNQTAWCRIPWPNFHNGKMFFYGLNFEGRCFWKQWGQLQNKRIKFVMKFTHITEKRYSSCTISTIVHKNMFMQPTES